MRLDQIHIEGFGLLTDLSCAFHPQINLFVGDNESGKSTLQQAMLAIFYGFYDGSRATPSERDRHERFRPWRGGPYAATVEYSLDYGGRYRIYRSFSTDDIPTQVTDLNTGRDVTREFGIGRHGNVPMARAHLGMSRQVFLSSCTVDQAAILELADPAGIAETLVRIADTGTRETSAARALRLLDGTLREKVGGPRARIRPLPRASERLQAKRQELAELEKSQDAIQYVVSERDALEAKAQGLRGSQRRLSYLVTSKKLEEVNQTLATAGEIRQQVARLRIEAESLSSYASFPADLRDAVLAEKGAIDLVAGQVSQLRENWEQVSPDFERVRGEIRQCRVEMETLKLARDFPLDKEDEFNRLRISRDNAVDGLSSLRGEEARYSQRVRSKSPVVSRATKAVLPGGLALAGAVALFSVITGFVSVGVPIALVMGVAAAAVYVMLRKGTFLEGLGDLRHRVESQERQVTLLESELSALFEDTGIRADSLDLAIELFRHRATSKKRLDELERRLEALEEKRTRLASVRDGREEKEKEADRSRAKLEQMLEAAGIEDADLEAALVKFDAAYRKRQRIDELRTGIRGKEQQQKLLLGDEGEAGLLASRDRMTQQCASMLDSAPELAGIVTSKTVEGLGEELNQVAGELADAEKKLVSLSATVKTTMSQHRLRSEIEEEVVRYQGEVRTLEEFASSLELAMEKLKEAADEVHKDFAPRLSAAVSQSLSVITGRRYCSAYVDPADFAIRVETPETGNIVGVWQLSVGTQEQAYLLLRVELARLMSDGGEGLPLFLDDPFVNFDDVRLERMLEFLTKLSQRNQIFLFSKDKFIARWFRSNLEEGKGFRVYALAPPAVPGSTS